jgi:hypothetical protein
LTSFFSKQKEQKMKQIKKLKDVTPIRQKQACWPLPGCSAIFESDDGHYVIVGELLDSKSLGITDRVSKNEVVIKVPKLLIDEMSHK